MLTILFYLTLFLLQTAGASADETAMLTGAKHGCETMCGNLTIPYPFGIGLDCSLNPFYSLTCNTNFMPAKAFLIDPHTQNSSENPRTIHEILNISATQLRIRNMVIRSCYNKKADIRKSSEQGMSLPPDSPFVISSTANKFITVGCGYTTWFVFGPGHGQEHRGSSYCNKTEDIVPGYCVGYNGCKEDVIPSVTRGFSIQIDIPNPQPIAYDRCGYGFTGEVNAFKFQGLSDFSDTNVFLERTLQTVPLVIDWVIGNDTCKDAKNNLCQENNAVCVDGDTGIGGYRCFCKTGFKGSPYISPGCTKIVNYPVLIIGLGVSILILAIVISCIYLTIRKRRLLILKEKTFTKNGGLLLKGQLSSMSEGGVEPIKIFTEKELKMATNNFGGDCIIGRGGSGIVYKGLLEGKGLIAIKKAIIIDEGQIEQFINELVILSQINHRNVVKLLGCCLEVEVPLLIYEFVPMGALFDQLHDGAQGSWLDWPNFLRIISEIANALAYLHYSANFPIIHRDIKSANILLDDNYTAKVSDFGASRLIPLDQTKMNTAVQGTLGYLDPEYMFSSELTKKSDVYSFGVLVAEILTRKKAVFSTKGAMYRNLANYFVESLRKGRIEVIADPQVVENARVEEIMIIAEIVGQCLSPKGEDRPTMKDIAAQLDTISNQVLAKN